MDPFWAAGVINRMAHWVSQHRSDASTIAPRRADRGEEFPGKYHATRRQRNFQHLVRVRHRLDVHPLLETRWLARVRRIAPAPRFSPGKTECDAATVKAVITHRHYVLAQYTRSVRDACRQEIRSLRRHAATPSGDAIDALSARSLLRWLRLYTWDWRARRPITLDTLVRRHKLLHTVYSMRQE
jgi:stearoyl-CoA desaturase (delta-9 desaturase)